MLKNEQDNDKPNLIFHDPINLEAILLFQINEGIDFAFNYVR